jgi:hypothetical protein
MMRKRVMRERVQRQAPHMLCYGCNHVVPGRMQNGSLRMVNHNPDTGEERTIPCIGQQFEDRSPIQHMGVQL